MSSTAFATNISDSLSASERKNELVTFLKNLKHECGTLSTEQVVIILGQWFHPLHYFPTFLSRLISVSPQIETQTYVSRILWEELGEGDPRRSHEKVYIETISDGGFAQEQVAGSPPLNATRRLVDGYEQASSNWLSGLGFLYGTEVVDLPMVATIGELMRRCTGKKDLPWVNIHVSQEPGHVDSANSTLKPAFSAEEQREIVHEAEQMWTLWIDFFKDIRQEILN
ncbi:MAG TPA: iron-containing redox enzyme family protein [Pyrinomonadaceae bacterium]|nr:iron-containing redox enzyme family protein [Pyrinomonadaceae bacterium]